MTSRRLRGFLLALCGLACLPAARAQDLIVSAAASLTAAFRQMGTEFEKAHPTVRITFNFAASGALLRQIAGGAPVDVFAGADTDTMDMAAEQGLIAAASRRDFASNRLVLVQPRTAPRLGGLHALKDASIERIAIGNPSSVPVGRYTRDVLLVEGLWEALGSKLILAENVRQVLNYVARGEVDAGVVYATDAASSDSVAVVAALSTPRPVLYPIAVVRTSRQPAAAAAFIAFVSGGAGQAVLRHHGFAAP